MNNLLLPSFGRLAARIYALSVILATTLLLTDIAAAQVEPLKTEPVAEKKTMCESEFTFPGMVY